MSVVYFIQAETGGPIKIGTALDVSKRIAMLQTGNPEQLVVLHTFPGQRDLESALHATLREHRIRGEWFADCPEVRRVMQSTPIALKAPSLDTFSEIIRSLGGTTSVARALNNPVSTVNTWSLRDSIPGWRFIAVVELAEKLGVPLTLERLIELAARPSDRKPSTSSAAAA